MQKKYEEFEKFSWADQRWQTYLDNLYPKPNYKQLDKFKRKFYKNTIDKDFDVTYDPDSAQNKQQEQR